MPLALAIFDLDNTLLAGDSDYLWGLFLAEEGIVNREEYERENERFYQDYKEGRLDIQEFMRFALRVLRDHSPENLQRWRERFVAEKIEPIVNQAALALVERHRAAGDTLMIITATNAFITAPIAERFGIPHLIASIPEEHEGRFTGNLHGTPSFNEGKVERLRDWLAEWGGDLRGSYFYSDSHNDIPLLEQVDFPVAVDPDERLARHAQERNWPIISLRESARP